MRRPTARADRKTARGAGRSRCLRSRCLRSAHQVDIGARPLARLERPGAGTRHGGGDRRGSPDNSEMERSPRLVGWRGPGPGRSRFGDRPKSDRCVRPCGFGGRRGHRSPGYPVASGLAGDSGVRRRTSVVVSGASGDSFACCAGHGFLVRCGRWLSLCRRSYAGPSGFSVDIWAPGSSGSTRFASNRLDAKNLRWRGRGGPVA